jgi:hypothetical protein
MDLLEYRSIIRNVFVALLIISVVILFLKEKNPFLFPGLWEKLLWIILILGTLNAVLYMPYEKLGFKLHRFITLRLKISGFKIKTKIVGKEEQIKIVLNAFFQFILILFLVFLFIRQFNETFLEVVDTKYFLLTIIVFGVFTIMFPPKKDLHQD